MPKPTLYLVDISSYVFRAYYAIRPLKTSKGIPTHATYGVINMLLKLIREKKPDSLVIVFDSPTPSFRKTLYPDYKANRDVPPEDLPLQFDHIKDFVKAYPLPSLQIDGYEADDLMATLVQKENMRPSHERDQIVIVSGDKDLMQLVGHGVVMYDSMKDKWIREAEVKERFGVLPSQVLDVLALAGDASDNIPGVPGVGEKTAAKLIGEWKSLENLLLHADELLGKLGENIRKHQELAKLSKQLASLETHVKLHPDWNVFRLGSPTQDDLNALYRELELHSLVVCDAHSQSVLGKENKSKSQQREYDLILDPKNLKRWAEKLKTTQNGFAFDTETTGLNPYTDQIVGISLSDEAGLACYIPLAHLYLGCPPQLSQEEVGRTLKPLFEHAQKNKFGQNVKFDMAFLSQQGFAVKGLAGDTLVAAYLLDPEGAHNLDHLSKEYLQEETLLYRDVVKKGETFAQVPVELACRYSAEDADMTRRLVDVLHLRLKQAGLWDCYEKIELPLIDVLFRMETQGVLMDVPFLKKLSYEFGGRLHKIETKIFEQVGFEFNVQSPKQVAKILFGKLALPVQRKTKTGFSTDVDVLTTLAPLHAVPCLLLEHRMLAKLQSTYVEQLQKLLIPKTGRVHTTYHQTIAATGRLTSTDPNLQNIPIKTADGRRIREAFCAPDGFKILSADYSQIELRLLAAFSQDKNLVQAFQNGADIHQMTAERIFGKAKGEEITSELRSMAKTVNFGILYGQSPFGLAHMLSISQTEAKKYIDEFYRQYPAVMQYKEKVLQDASQTGEIRTWMGRRRLVPELSSGNRLARMNAERAAFNTIFQGSAADLIKVAMIHVDEKLRDQFKAKMILQVHDELVFEVPEDEIAEVSKMIKEEMEKALPCDVPLKVDVGVGNHWAEAH